MIKLAKNYERQGTLPFSMEAKGDRNDSWNSDFFNFLFNFYYTLAFKFLYNIAKCYDSVPKAKSEWKNT